MNSFLALIPQATLFFGILVLAILEAFQFRVHPRQTWIIHFTAVTLAFAQQILLYRVPDGLFARGGIILDGTTQIFSLCVLALAIIVQLHRTEEKYAELIHTSILTLGITVFSLFAIQSNRIFYGSISITAMIWLAHGALASEVKSKEQARLVYSGFIRGLIFLVVGCFLCIFCLALFGETQTDEIQRVLVRGAFREFPIYAVGVIIMFLSAMIIGVPPFEGILGESRKNASWSMALGVTGFFAIVGVYIFFRWGVLVFVRPAVGALEFEPLTSWNALYALRTIAVVALILTPIYAIAHRSFRGGLQFFILNPFAQSLFSISFGHRDVIGVAIAQVVVCLVVVGILISAMQYLDFSPDATLQDWLALGRKSVVPCLCVIFGLTCAAGFAPFFGSLLIQKTLGINSIFGLFLLFNIVLAGFYVGRLLTLAFHHSDRADSEPSKITGGQKLWFALQVSLLIFMGIFWQPLYKYGAFSIRQFFGDV